MPKQNMFQNSKISILLMVMKLLNEGKILGLCFFNNKTKGIKDKSK